MFGNLPKPTKNSASNIIDELKNFGERIPKKLKDYSSGLVDAVKDLANTRLIYDGCNAGIRVGNGGLVKFYRNKYCGTTPPPPPPPTPSSFYVGGECDCAMLITFAFHAKAMVGYVSALELANACLMERHALAALERKRMTVILPAPYLNHIAKI